MKCPCKDSQGHVCGKEMTVEEVEGDGMCGFCADNVWAEMHSEEEYEWYHEGVV